MSEQNDIDFERRTKRLFDDSVSSLDASTRSRLAQARSRALEELATRHGRWSPLLPVAVAAGMVLVAWLVVWQAPPAGDVVQGASLGDLEILLGEEDLEMLGEELEFYGWLEEQPEFANGLDSVG